MAIGTEAGYLAPSIDGSYKPDHYAPDVLFDTPRSPVTGAPIELEGLHTSFEPAVRFPDGTLFTKPR